MPKNIYAQYSYCTGLLKQTTQSVQRTNILHHFKEILVIVSQYW